MANIRDVAKEAEVSITTVSRILSGDASFHVSDATRQRVLQAAEHLGYVYKTASRHKKVRLGCILAYTTDKFSDPFFEGILVAAEATCVQEGAAITFKKNYEDLRSPGFLQELREAELDGLLLMERVSGDMYRQLKEIVPHILSVDDTETDFGFDSVGFDHVAANRQVMDCLLDHGYRRIGIISGGSPSIPFSQTLRLMVYRETLHQAGIPYDPALVRDCAWDLELCAAQTRELLSLPEPPDVIFAGSDSLASVVLGTLYSMGLRCPRDVGVIGFNNINLSSHMIPPLTTVDIPVAQIGISAVQRMMDMIRSKRPYPCKILFPTTLIKRESLREVSI